MWVGTWVERGVALKLFWSKGKETFGFCCMEPQSHSMSLYPSTSFLGTITDTVLRKLCNHCGLTARGTG